MDLVAVSKTLSHMLRHAPEEYGIRLDAEGFARLEAVLAALRSRWPELTADHLRELAAPSDKQRFELVGEDLRATYGHSRLSLSYPRAEPPPYLYHGTARRHLASIGVSGLNPGRRQYVHMAETVARARTVGLRRDEQPAIVEIIARAAHQRGVPFYRAADQTWLARHVPPQFLREVAER